ncbi:MAG: hypothetical protein U0V72_06325 [Cytophagales bacterium]
MNKKFNLLLISLFYIFSNSCFASEILGDATAISIIKNGLAKTYNYEFDKAEEYFLKIKQTHPSSPAYYLLEAILTNIQYPNLNPNISSKEYKYLIENLQKTISLADHILKTKPTNLEAIFYKLNALSLIGSKYSEAKDYTKALNYAKQTYDYLKKGMAHKQELKEFYFSSGLYNYYTIQYPESHPIVKPIMWFFEKGNKSLGLKELEFASQNTIFSQNEALYFLSNIYFKYEENPTQSLKYLKLLSEKYPKNSFYQFKNAELNIYFNNKEDLFENLDSISTNKSPFYQVAYWALNGHYQLISHYNISKVKASFNEALKIAEQYKIKNQELICLIHLGLARCYWQEKNKIKAKNHYEIAKDNTSNKLYLKEIKTHFD